MSVMVSERGLAVLRAIVRDYVASREPVGSKSIVERHAFGVSAATIRNDMALLEDEELIAAPHTSSGRVPTDKGYRLFVDHLEEIGSLTTAQRSAIERFLGEASDLDEAMSRSVRLLSQLTNNVALVQYPVFSASRVRHLELVALAPSKALAVLITDSGRVDQRVVDLGDEVDEVSLGEVRAKLTTAAVGLPLAEAAEALRGANALFPPAQHPLVARITGALIDQVGSTRQDRLVIAGAATLARTEDDFSGSIFPVLEAIEEQVVLLKLFAEMEADARGIAVSIGRENAAFGLGETSVLSSDYQTTGGQRARLGVLGPTRMDYSNNMAAVRAVARYLSRLLGED